MANALQERPGVVAGCLAFLAAACSGFALPFRGDLVGPLGLVPPLVFHVLALLVAPGLAAVAGHRLVRAPSVEATLPWAIAAAAVGAPVGRLVGTKLGFALVTGRLGRGVPTRLLVESYVVPAVPHAVAATAGVVGGVAYRRVTASPRAGSATPGLLVAVGGGGFVAGFAHLMTQFAALYAAHWTLLPEPGWLLLGLVGTPLAVALGGATVDESFGVVGSKQVAGTSVVGVALGTAAAALYASVAWWNALAFFAPQLERVVVDAVGVAAVLALAAVAGVAAGQD
jgi:hypothetical protein